MQLDLGAADAAMATVTADIHSLVVDTAAGVHTVVNQNMAAAARMHAVQRGLDLRGGPPIAFGGAGPLPACGVDQLRAATRVSFPVHASALSPFPTPFSPVRIDRTSA